jgi:hypothetical protein
MEQRDLVAINFNQQVFAGSQAALASGVYPLCHRRMS